MPRSVSVLTEHATAVRSLYRQTLRHVQHLPGVETEVRALIRAAVSERYKRCAGHRSAQPTQPFQLLRDRLREGMAVEEKLRKAFLCSLPLMVLQELRPLWSHALEPQEVEVHAQALRNQAAVDEAYRSTHAFRLVYLPSKQQDGSLPRHINPLYLPILQDEHRHAQRERRLHDYQRNLNRGPVPIRKIEHAFHSNKSITFLRYPGGRQARNLGSRIHTMKQAYQNLMDLETRFTSHYKPLCEMEAAWEVAMGDPGTEAERTQGWVAAYKTVTRNLAARLERKQQALDHHAQTSLTDDKIAAAQRLFDEQLIARLERFAAFVEACEAHNATRHPLQRCDEAHTDVWTDGAHPLDALMRSHDLGASSDANPASKGERDTNLL